MWSLYERDLMEEIRWQVALRYDDITYSLLRTDVPTVELPDVIQKAWKSIALTALIRPRTPALQITRMDAVTYSQDRAASRKGKRRHPTTSEWQRVLTIANREAKAIRMTHARLAKSRGGSLGEHHNKCGITAFRCDHS